MEKKKKEKVALKLVAPSFFPPSLFPPKPPLRGCLGAGEAKELVGAGAVWVTASTCRSAGEITCAEGLETAAGSTGVGALLGEKKKRGKR